ncbi:MAG: UDP-N-acetylmuramoyl-L-alanine--D-glutamate ligase [Syntrophomonas sp.]|nr:UDP-N-acetylmuramoyl-L-alanine--D-glutamate ligase [Syntrophomonas sp.]
MPFKGKRILIMGLARSGMAAVVALHRRGALLSAYDAKDRSEIEMEIKNLTDLGVPVFAGVDPPLAGAKWDMIVVSPGVPRDTELLKKAYALGIPVIGELELAYQMKSEPVKMYAITGTNGKTTSTALFHYILEKDGRQTAMGGNIGTALCGLVDKMPSGEIVVEVSSFQLETAATFKPHIAAVLNITPDHLDRHKTMAEYVKTKGRICSRQNCDDYLILNYEDERVRRFNEVTAAQVRYFSADRILDEGIYVDNNFICIVENGKRMKIAPLDDILLRGKHNLENILCAVAMAWIAGVREEVIHKSLTTFAGVRHRLEEVAKHRGVLYINDSKGTNPDSTIKALESFDEPIVLIAGGRAKGGDYSTVARLMANKVKDLVLLGEAKELIKTAVMDYGFQNIHEVEDLVAAVTMANELAVAGDIVLLSPACASWDMFPSYEHRGDLFCEQVAKIIERDNKLA